MRVQPTSWNPFIFEILICLLFPSPAHGSSMGVDLDVDGFYSYEDGYLSLLQSSAHYRVVQQKKSEYGSALLNSTAEESKFTLGEIVSASIHNEGSGVTGQGADAFNNWWFFSFAIVALCIILVMREPKLQHLRSAQIKLILCTALLLNATTLFPDTITRDNCFGMLWRTFLEGAMVYVTFVIVPSAIVAYKTLCESAQLPASTNAEGSEPDAPPSAQHALVEVADAAAVGTVHDAQELLRTASYVIGACILLRLVEPAWCCVVALNGGETTLSVLRLSLGDALLLGAICFGWYVVWANKKAMSLGCISTPIIQYATLTTFFSVTIASQNMFSILLAPKAEGRALMQSFYTVQVTLATLVAISIFERSTMQLGLSAMMDLTEKPLVGQELHTLVAVCSRLLYAIYLLVMPASSAHNSDLAINLSALPARPQWQAQGSVWLGVMGDMFSVRVRSMLLPSLLLLGSMLTAFTLENLQTPPSFVNNEVWNVVALVAAFFVAWVLLALFTFANNICWNKNWLLVCVVGSIVKCIMCLISLTDGQHNGALGYVRYISYLASWAATGVGLWLVLCPEEDTFFYELATDAALYTKFLMRNPKYRLQLTQKPGGAQLENQDEVENDQSLNSGYVYMCKRLFAIGFRFPPLLVLSFVVTAPALFISGYGMYKLMDGAINEVRADIRWVNSWNNWWPFNDLKQARGLIHAFDTDENQRLSLREAWLENPVELPSVLTADLWRKEHGNVELGDEDLSRLLQRARMQHAAWIAWRLPEVTTAGTRAFVSSLDANGDGLLEFNDEFVPADVVAGFRRASGEAYTEETWHSLAQELESLWQHAASDCGRHVQREQRVVLDVPAAACLLARLKFELVRLHVRSGDSVQLPYSPDDRSSLLGKSTVQYHRENSGLRRKGTGILTSLVHWLVSLDVALGRISVSLDIALFAALIFAICVLAKPFFSHVRMYEARQTGADIEQLPEDIIRQRFDYAPFFPGIYFSTVMFSFTIVAFVVWLVCSLLSSTLFWEILWYFRVYLLTLAVAFFLQWAFLRRLLLDWYCTDNGLVVAPRVFACVWCVLSLLNFAVGLLSVVERFVFVLPAVMLRLCDFETSLLFGSLKVWDSGYTSFILLFHMNYENSNPVRLSFIGLLNKSLRTSTGEACSEPKTPEESRRKIARNRWHLARFLISNPLLRKNSKSKEAYAKLGVTAEFAAQISGSTAQSRELAASPEAASTPGETKKDECSVS